MKILLEIKFLATVSSIQFNSIQFSHEILRISSFLFFSRIFPSEISSLIYFLSTNYSLINLLIN